MGGSQNRERLISNAPKPVEFKNNFGLSKTTTFDMFI